MEGPDVTWIRSIFRAFSPSPTTAAFPATAVAAEVAAGRLATREITHPRLTRRLVLARSPSRIMNAAALAVAALVRERLDRR